MFMRVLGLRTSPLFAPDGPAGGSSDASSSSPPQTSSDQLSDADGSDGASSDFFSGMGSDHSDERISESALPEGSFAADGEQQPFLASPATTTPVADRQEQTPASQPVSQQPSQEQQSQQPAQPERPLDFARDPAQFLQVMSQQEADVVGHLAREHFQLSDEDAQEFETDYRNALPKLAAKVFYRTMAANLARMVELMPAMVAAHSQRQQQSEQLMGSFFKQWPMLNAQQHGKDIMRIGTVYRQMNPQASFEQFNADVGLMVAQSLGLLGQAPTNRSQPPFRPAGNARVRPGATRPVGWLRLTRAGEVVADAMP